LPRFASRGPEDDISILRAKLAMTEVRRCEETVGRRSLPAGRQAIISPEVRLNMKIIILVLFLVSYQLSAISYQLSFASDQELFIYDSQGNRDPFMALLTKDGRPVTVYGSISSIGDVVVEGILFDPQGGSFVIINDMILKHGDSISGVTVKKIEINSVVLSFKGEDHTFKIKE
jgi:type II secretory pathway component PulC